MSHHHSNDICKGPVLPEPTKEETVPQVDLVVTDAEPPEKPDAVEASQRRASFSGGIDSLGQGNIL